MYQSGENKAVSNKAKHKPWTNLERAAQILIYIRIREQRTHSERRSHTLQRIEDQRVPRNVGRVVKVPRLPSVIPTEVPASGDSFSSNVTKNKLKALLSSSERATGQGALSKTRSELYPGPRHGSPHRTQKEPGSSSAGGH